jgi:DNA-binding MarR family transcriptional regulator
MAAAHSRKKKSKTKLAPQAVAAPGLGQVPAQTASMAPTRAAAQATPKRATDDKATTDNGLFEGFLPHLIARLAYQLNADLIEKLRLEGINIARWRILAVLAMGDGITISEIIDRAMMQQSALSRVLMTMESEEYVRRVPRRDDGRYVDVFLTEKGRTLFNSLDTVVRRRQNRLLKGFSPQETEAAFALMRRLSRNLVE